ELGSAHPSDDIFFTPAAAARALPILFRIVGPALAKSKPYVGRNQGPAAFANFTMPTHSRPIAGENCSWEPRFDLGQEDTDRGVTVAIKNPIGRHYPHSVGGADERTVKLWRSKRR